MDEKQLIDLITQEVINALSKSAASEKQDLAKGSTSAAGGAKNFDKALAAMIDHTLLRPDATEEEVVKLCEEAKAYKFCSVCVNTSWVGLARKKLLASGVKVCCVVGFPLGAMDCRTKAYETREAIANGADEIDMVLNIGALKSRDLKLVEQDIRSVVQAARGKVTKVILETGLLSQEEKVLGCELSKKCGASFVKTSTGFAKGGATVEDIELMRKTVGPRMGVKASGGVRNLADSKKMIAAGATRIGTSSGIAIVTGGEGKGY